MKVVLPRFEIRLQEPGCIGEHAVLAGDSALEAVDADAPALEVDVVDFEQADFRGPQSVFGVFCPTPRKGKVRIKINI